MMEARQLVKTSRFLSLILRHKPEKVGIRLDPAGWVDVDMLLRAVNESSRPLTRGELQFVVEMNDKRRFEFSEDGDRIRASQGHSVQVDLQYEPCQPPETLLHGTVERFLNSIRQAGLNKGSRHHVHLHDDRRVAVQVGNRRGSAVILTIRSAEMHRAGYEFYLSTNGVWLTDHVPQGFIEFP